MRAPICLPQTRDQGFTLIEMLVAFAVLALIMVLLLAVTGQVQSIYQSTQAKSEQFREARTAFEALTRRVALATLNTYWDYDDPANPQRYLRQSELRFRCGNASAMLPSGTQTTTHAIFFQAPFGAVNDTVRFGGMESLLNTYGYFVEYGSDATLRPPILASRVALQNRFRLFELIEPADNLSLYKYTSGNPGNRASTWFSDPLNRSPRPARVLAENVVALVLTAAEPDLANKTYGYDTTPDTNPTTQTAEEHQLPPVVQVMMVAIDDESALRLAERFPSTMPVCSKVTWFNNATQYPADVAALESRLSGKDSDFPKVNYRIFTSNISISGARWSREPQ